MIREYAVSACSKCGGNLFTEIIGWDEERHEILLDYLTCYCEEGCASYNVKEIEMLSIVEVEQ